MCLPTLRSALHDLLVPAIPGALSLHLHCILGDTEAWGHTGCKWERRDLNSTLSPERPLKVPGVVFT